MSGTLYGIGVGPGDPDLIPLKALKVLQRVRLVFAPIARPGGESLRDGCLLEDYNADVAGACAMLHAASRLKKSVASSNW